MDSSGLDAGHGAVPRKSGQDGFVVVRRTRFIMLRHVDAGVLDRLSFRRMVREDHASTIDVELNPFALHERVP